VSGAKFQVPSSQPPVSYTPQHLAERIRAEQAALEARGATDGERKTITVLFADIKGSMALIEDLDPEEARALVDPALALMMDAVHRYEGYVAQSTGDGIFAFFGAPIAHEDHPQRALYAALRMQEDLKRYADKLRLDKGRNVEIRVGINTGDVVLRSIRKDDLRTEYTPISHSTSLASRMEGLAPGGSIVVSEQTYKLTDGYFEFKPLGAARIKGVSEPVNIYEVLGVGPLRTRLQAAARRGLVRFVGRQQELAQLRRALEQANTGRGQIVGVMGDPGVGKSRLFHEFKLLSSTGCLVLETFSVSHGKAYAYLPLIDLLKNYFQITPQDDERQ
jgi:class 3 adenylate cyclase